MKKIITLVSLVILFTVTRTNAQAWLELGGGLGATSEEVKAIAVDPNGHVYVGGTFTGAHNYIVKWNGSAWVDLGTVNGPVYSIGIKTASDIYVGGQFTSAGGTAVNNIARLSGSVWSAVGSGFNGKVLCVYVPGSGIVYAGGEFSLSGTTPVNHIAKLQGSNWVAMGSGISSNVNAIVEHRNGIYAGCDMSNNPVMRYDGLNSWSSVSGLSGGKVLSLASYWGYLFAGGTFTSPSPAIAKHGGGVWNTAITNFAFGHRVNVLYPRSDALYIGGNFTAVGIGTPNYIARITNPNEPIKSFTISSELTNGEVFAIGKVAGYVYAGGKFTTPNPVTNNISITSMTIDVNELNNVVVDKQFFPNPAHGKATLTLNTESPLKNPVLQIYDAQSKLVQSGLTAASENNKHTFDIDLSQSPAGNYYYVIVSEGQTVSSDMFIVE